MDELTESCLALDESEGDTLLSAELGQEHHHLEGVNIMSDDDELGLVGFNEFGNVVETEFQNYGLGSLVLISLVDLVFGFLLESDLLFFVGFGTVLSK